MNTNVTHGLRFTAKKGLSNNVLSRLAENN